MNRNRSKTADDGPQPGSPKEEKEINKVERKPSKEKKDHKKSRLDDISRQISATSSEKSKSRPKHKRKKFGLKLKNRRQIDSKEKELNENHADLKKVLDALVESIHSSEDQDLIVKLSYEAGKFVEKSAEIKQELCNFYEEERLRYLEEEDNDSIDEESFVFYAANLQKLKEKDTQPNSDESDGDKTKIVSEGSSTANQEIESSNSASEKPQGYLVKKNGVRNKWTKRYFVLDSSTYEIRWFTDEETYMKAPKKPKGKIEIQKAKIVHKLDDLPSSPSTTQSGDVSTTRFCIQSPAKNLILEAKDEQDRKEWIRILQEFTDEANGSSSKK